eukprot:1157955-Amorphochlora_amoeboformis.AAC.1
MPEIARDPGDCSETTLPVVPVSTRKLDRVVQQCSSKVKLPTITLSHYCHPGPDYRPTGTLH